MSDDITDTELIRYLDGELQGAERAALAARISAVPDAAARMARLHRRSARLSTLLDELNPDAGAVSKSAAGMRSHVMQAGVRVRPRMTPAMKVAATIILLLGFAFIVPPARAWIVDGVRSVARALGLAPRRDTPIVRVAPVPPQPAPTDAQSAEVNVTFAAAVDTFELSLAQRAGHLILRRDTKPLASAQASGVAGTSFVVLPGGLRIEGPTSADATYTLTLPTRVQVVRLVRGERVRELHTLAAPGRELGIDLSRD